MFSMLLLATHLEHLSEIYCFTQPQDINQNPDVCVCSFLFSNFYLYLSNTNHNSRTWYETVITLWPETKDNI